VPTSKGRGAEKFRTSFNARLEVDEEEYERWRGAVGVETGSILSEVVAGEAVSA
jgi:hypothetical protein